MTMELQEKHPSRRSVRALLALHPFRMPEPWPSAGPTLPVSSSSATGTREDPVHPAADAGVATSRGMPVRPLGGRSKRVLDLMVASCALVAAAPIMLLVALLIKCTAGGPVVYSHRRVGFDGRPFYCHKFRSMVRDADRVLKDHLERNPSAAREWEEKRKLENDPRVTLLGTMLRKSSLDELPQLFNILRGEMSCVGPRPIVADELDRYGTSVSDYLCTRPGLTGLWQVTGRSSTDYCNRVYLDSQYVRNWSIFSDLVILARTVVAVMRFDEAS